ncbi:MAG: GNAT family N-acetyltransferase [Calothrix sp. MO_192.B10]|nr:GNAT family N-acetyltransferase [Calothrix sp. MO_192.B10]
MKLEIFKALKHDKLILQRMLELHQHDISPFSKTDLNVHGEFSYTYLDHYWVEDGRYPYLAKSAGKLVGFALVNTHKYLPDSQYSMAEFFVMKRYRRQGIGKALALHVFDQHRGMWEVCQLPGHTEAVAFWKRIISDYTAGIFKEIVNGYGEWQGSILQFDNHEG